MDFLSGKIKTIYFKYLSAAFLTFSEITSSYLHVIWGLSGAGLEPYGISDPEIHSGNRSVYAAGILAEIGSVRCFNTNNALAKYSGIIWRDNQSGEF